MAKRYVVRLDEEGRIQIPAELLREVGATPGSYVTLQREGDMIVIKPKAKRTSVRLDEELTVEEMERAVEEMLDEMVDA